MGRKLVKLSVAVALSFILVGALLCLAVRNRDTFRYVVFRPSYSFSSDHALFLQQYSESLDGGYVPGGIDEFLCSRLQFPTSESEFRAIVYFYLHRCCWHTGERFGHVPDTTKVRIIALLVHDLDTLGQTRDSAFILAEYLRLDGNLWKPRFDGADTVIENKAEPIAGALDDASQLFKRWWESSPDWQTKKRISPWQGSRFSVHSLQA